MKMIKDLILDGDYIPVGIFVLLGTVLLPIWLPLYIFGRVAGYIIEKYGL